MKRKENRNKFKIGKSVIVTLLMAIFTVSLVGCKKPVEASSEPIPSEVVSEEVSDSASEEISETTTEDTSEIVSEEVVEQVEIINCANFDELLAYLEDFNKTTIVVYNFSSGVNQIVIPNGEKSAMKMDDTIGVFPHKEITDVQAKVDYITVMKPLAGYTDWGIFVNTTGTDIEVSFTVVYEDGTEEDFTIYITTEGE